MLLELGKIGEEKLNKFLSKEREFWFMECVRLYETVSEFWITIFFSMPSFYK